ncbi:hypothetical protein MRB53_012711 [Persea americana]|uniref:Uncharacterized protein n=1 Tax=Persea americana TaxID=3435 RepID=A0ACC2LZG5_PERAE|nr:hypothetical protein MRB53_012711 [Persea americana]
MSTLPECAPSPDSMKEKASFALHPRSVIELEMKEIKLGHQTMGHAETNIADSSSAKKEGSHHCRLARAPC